MLRMEYKHFEKEFRTKFKLFSFSLVGRGSVVRIIERRKTETFSINLDLGGAAWLSDAIKSILQQNKGEEFKRLFRAHDYRVILESSRNSAGRFMKICKIQYGTLSSLFIPEETNCQGWKKFYSSLDSFFATKKVQRKERLEITEDKQQHEGRMEYKQRRKEEVEDQQIRDWRKAMVIYRNTIHISWGELRKRVEVSLRRKVEVTPLAVDRAIIWCQNEEEISSLLSNPLQFSNGKNHVKLERWNQFAHWDNLQIHVNLDWYRRTPN